MYKIFFIFLFIAGSYLLNSQSNLPVRKIETGFFYGAVSSQNTFDELGSSPNCCPDSYEQGSGYSLIIPANYYRNIYEKFYLIVGLNFQYENLDFTFIEKQPIRGETASVLHSLNSEVYLLGLKSGLQYSFGKVNIASSLNLLFPINSFFSQSERLTSGGAFDEEGNILGNEFKNVDLTMMNSLILRSFTSINYKIEFKRKYSISPNISYQFDLLNLHSENEWHTNGFYFGLTFTYSIFRKDASPIEPANY